MKSERTEREPLPFEPAQGERARSGRGIATVSAFLFLSVTTCAPAATVPFIQRSEPPGLYSSEQDLESGVWLTTLDVPQSTASYHFTHWTINGVEQRDELGLGITPITFLILQPTTATCHHVLSSLDADGDGVHDWYEIHVNGHTNGIATSDPDGDGFGLAQEYRRDYHPHLTNEIVDGGFSIMLAPITPEIDMAGKHTFDRRSEPDGLWLGYSAVLDHGTIVTNDDVYGSVDGYSFCYWTLNGVRQTDRAGRAVSRFAFALQTNSVAIAHYIPSDQDADGDGVYDWIELNYYGSTNTAPSDDTDLDGYSFAEELRWEYHPLLTNEIVDGGWSLTLAPETPVLVDTNLVIFTTRSDPFHVLQSSDQAVEVGATVTVDESYGLQGGLSFCYWTLNGVIQTDPAGRALSGFDVTVLSNTVAEAVYRNTHADEDGDSMPDWLELNYTGSLAGNPADDADRDGFGLAEEIRRDYHPSLTNEIRDGGFSLMLAPPQHLEPAPGYAVYIERSVPEGAVPTREEVLPRGSVVNTAAAPTTSGGRNFVFWTVNDVQERDEDGIPRASATFVFESNTVAEAHYVNATVDDDEDGALDWLEYYYHGTTDFPVTLDLDGDGFSLVEELRRHYQCGITNEVRDGGFSIILGSSVNLNLQFHPRVGEALQDGAPTAFFATDATGTFSVAANSHPAVGDWDGDGDLDLFVGGSNGVMRVFENAGSPQVMNLVERTTNFAALASLWAGITNPAPALGDWTGDGCADLAVGGETGGVQLVVSPGSFRGDALTGALPTEARESPVRSVPVRAYPSPRKIPPDEGTTNRYEMDRRADVRSALVRASPRERERGTCEVGVSPVRSAPVRAYPPPTYALTGTLQTNVHVGTSLSVPAFGDVDGDGWVDLLVLGEDGRVRFFPHTHIPTAPYAGTPATADLLKSAVPDATGITTADVNEDGVADVLISDDNGNVWEFHGRSGP